MPELLQLALTVASIAQGVVYVGLALLLVAFIWWVFRVQRDPEWSFYAATRAVLLLALVAALVLAAVPFIRWMRQLTS
jgi:hypothetical protein